MRSDSACPACRGRLSKHHPSHLRDLTGLNGCLYPNTSDREPKDWECPGCKLKVHADDSRHNLQKGKCRWAEEEARSRKGTRQIRKSPHRRQSASPTRLRGSPGILEPRGEEAEAADAADGLPPLPPPDAEPPAAAADDDEAAEREWNAEVEGMDE